MQKQLNEPSVVITPKDIKNLLIRLELAIPGITRNVIHGRWHQSDIVDIVDGIYYASLGGERDLLTDEEFDKWIKPFDLRVMQTIRETGCYCFLHICKDGLNMERYRDFAPLADVVNWGIYEAPFSLEEGKKLFGGCTIMGGLPNRSGVMTEGTEEQLNAAVRQLVSEQGKTRFILGADCTLPSEISWSRIRSISDTVHTV